MARITKQEVHIQSALGIFLIFKAEDSKFLSDSDINTLKELGSDVVFYDYHYKDYEGSGEMVIEKNGELYFYSLGHCSCYGSIEHVEFADKYKVASIKELLAMMSSDYVKETTPLINLLSAHGYLEED